jgi:hypothetical protein
VQQGHPVITSLETNSGHIVVFNAVSADGKSVIASNPGREEAKEIAIDKLTSACKEHVYAMIPA